VLETDAIGKPKMRASKANAAVKNGLGRGEARESPLTLNMNLNAPRVNRKIT
jgi:hypothetical protein